jgi:Mn2+/Fe2+ NRAMP family transporter
MRVAILTGPVHELALRLSSRLVFQCNAAYSLTFVATVGTTITPYLQVYVQSGVAETNLTMATCKYQRVDVYVGIHILGV